MLPSPCRTRKIEGTSSLWPGPSLLSLREWGPSGGVCGQSPRRVGASLGTPVTVMELLTPLGTCVIRVSPLHSKPPSSSRRLGEKPRHTREAGMTKGCRPGELCSQAAHFDPRHLSHSPAVSQKRFTEPDRRARTT